jgi:hypothetical protein
MTLTEALEELALCHNAVIRFHRSPEGEPLLRIGVEDKNQERIIVTKVAVHEDDVIGSLTEAVADTLIEFRAQERRAGMRVVV